MHKNGQFSIYTYIPPNRNTLILRNKCSIFLLTPFTYKIIVYGCFITVVIYQEFIKFIDVLGGWYGGGDEDNGPIWRKHEKQRRYSAGFVNNQDCLT